MHVVIFEGIHWRTFAPLSLSRPVFMLATGAASLLEKQIRHTNPSRLTLWVRPELEEFARQRIVPRLSVPVQVNAPLDDEPALLLSGRTLHLRKYNVPEEESVVLDEGEVVRSAFIRNRAGLTPADAMRRSDRWMEIVHLPRMEPQTRLVEHLWDLIDWNEESLIEDFARRQSQHRPESKMPFHVIEPENIWIGPDAVVQPGVVLDGSKGPVMIGARAQIGANAVIQGPCSIGEHAQITPLALIRPGTTIGKMCKVGGEVSSSILFGYTNKAHEGFLGHSYVGKWTNLGAGTTTSNLKNTYGQITVMTPSGTVNTGKRFLGAMIGDHAKTAIGTRLMAGSYIGFAAQVALSGIAPRSVQSFTFRTDQGTEPYKLEKAIEVMKVVFSRRERAWTDLDESVVRYARNAGQGVEIT